jgi:hypothetical protein
VSKLGKLGEILDQQADIMWSVKMKEEVRNYKGTPMLSDFAKEEIVRYLRLGVDKSDVVCILSSWGLTKECTSELLSFIQTWKPDARSLFDEFGERVINDDLPIKTSEPCEPATHGM